MKRIIKKIALLLAVAYIALIPLTSYNDTAFAATTSFVSPYKSLIDKWKSYGLLDSSFNMNTLENPVQKIDYIILLNNIMKSSGKTGLTFKDVPKDSWYSDEISKAVASGYVENQTGNYYPFSNISRLDAAMIVAKVFKLKLKDQRTTSKIMDATRLSDEQLEAFSACVERGYIKEISTGKYAPTGIIKLIDVITMLDSAMGQIISKAGTITTSYKSNVLVNAPNVTLKNMSITGDLIIAEGVGEGNTTLDNVSVSGKLIIRGGGPNSITIKNSKVGDSVLVEKSAGNVNVVATGSTSIENTYISSGVSLQEKSLGYVGKGFINVIAQDSLPGEHTATLRGDFNSIKINDDNIIVKLYGSADNVNVAKDVKNTTFSLQSGAVKVITTEASKNSIELAGGVVNSLNVTSSAIANKITITSTSVGAIMLKANTAITAERSTISAITLDYSSEGSFINVKNDASITTLTVYAPSTITGIGKLVNAIIYANNVKLDLKPTGTYMAIGGAIGAPNANLLSVSVSASDITLQEGKTQSIGAGIYPSDASISYISSDNSIATVNDKGVVTGVSAGSTTIHITVQKVGYNGAVVSIKVDVTSGNITADGSITVSPDTAETGTKQDFRITYTAGDNMSNGTVVIMLPAGFSTFDGDVASINGATFNPLDASQRPNIQTISFTNLNLERGQTIVVALNNRVVPSGGNYTFTAISDADGTGPKLPTSRGETFIFSSNSLRLLVEGANYSIPEYGTVGGTTKVAKLLPVGITGSKKWVSAITDAQLAVPTYNDTLDNKIYSDYTMGSNLTASMGQYLRLAAVDETNRVKGYKDIKLTAAMIRPFTATGLVEGSDYKKPTVGTQAYTSKIEHLDITNVSGSATKWMIKVQNSAPTDVFVDSEFIGATDYTQGTDIKVIAGQHIVLAATDASNKIKAFADIPVTTAMVSKAADLLQVDNNYELPEFGSVVNSTKIKTLKAGGFTDINKWMVVILPKDAVIPAVDVDISEYQTKYIAGGSSFTAYTQNSDITGATDGSYLLLVGVNESGTKQLIKAYASIPLDTTCIRQADVQEIPAINYSLPEMGTSSGTTMFRDINFTRPLTGAALSADVTKYMFKVQNEPFAVPQINSMLSGAQNVSAKQNISVTSGQNLILLATDANGKIKAYKVFAINETQIRPADALKMIAPNDYSTPQPGSAIGTTRVVLSEVGIPGWTAECKWQIKVQNEAFAVPYKGQALTGMTDYTKGSNINISVGQNLLIVAVNETGGVLAYAIETISNEQIKQPSATLLKASSAVTGEEVYNYSDPEPGQEGDTTRIASLNTMGVQGATRWAYKISDTEQKTIPDYNTTLVGATPYIQGDSIKIKANQHIYLFAVDNTNRIKGYADITVQQAQIRTPSAYALTIQTNYAVPSGGDTEGTTRFTSLSFAGLEDTTDLVWKYIVGDNMFNAPAVDSDAAKLGTLKDLTTTTDIAVKSGQYVMLLAVKPDASKGMMVKGYANVYISPSYIRPFDAADLKKSSYSLTKGTSEGTTKFDNLDLIGIIGATGWMYKVQKDQFAVPALDMPVTGSNVYSPKNDIAISAGWHLLLLATDQQGRVKAYADIIVDKDQIQAPRAHDLTVGVNYTTPEPGSAEGTMKIMLNDVGIEKKDGEAVVWKYKSGTTSFKAPLLDESSAGEEYKVYTSNADIKAAVGDFVMVVATINNNIKAFTQFTVSPSYIKPLNAPELKEGQNYSVPVPGSRPGTIKISGLKFIGVIGATKWQYKIVDAGKEEIIGLDTILTTPINYADANDIQVKKNQVVVLAAVDDNGKVKAYKNIVIDNDSYLNPPLATKLTEKLNYGDFKYGTQTGTTSIYTSLAGVNGATAFVTKVVDKNTDVIDKTTISYTTTGAAIDYIKYLDYQLYTSGSDIMLIPGQYVLIVAINTSGQALAYMCEQVKEEDIRPKDATKLLTPQNYSTPVPGSDVGTTKFTELNTLGVDAVKWLVRVQDGELGEIPLINSTATGAVVYDVNKDIQVREGQYIILYASDSQGRVKGYASIQVIASHLRGVAPLLKLKGTGSSYNYSDPVPGSTINTTKFHELVLPADATQWKYAVQDSAATLILKDSILTGYTAYTPDKDITVQEGQHVILVATDNAGYTKAYADITLVSRNVRNVEATLSGTVFTLPTGEGNIISGGRTISIQLNYGQWADDVVSDSTKRNALYDGLTASTEQTQWGKVVAALKNEGTSAIALNAQNNTLTITLSEVKTYDITANQTITITLKPELIKNGTKSVISNNSFTVAADVIATLDGTAVTQGMAEGDIVQGGRTLSIVLTNGEFALDVASNKAKRDAIFSGIKAANVPAEWSKVTQSLIDAGENAFTRNSKSKVTILLPPIATYDINMNEVLSVTLPYKTTSGEAILVGAIKDVIIPGQLIVSANAAANISGTIIGLTSEQDIVTGGKTIIVKLSDGQWAQDVDTDVNKRNALFSGLVTSTETTQWAKVVTLLKNAGQGAILRDSNTTITIILPAVAGYDITQNQYVNLNIPPACIVGAKAPLIANETIKIDRIAGATIAGTAVGTSVDESAIRNGGKTITVSLVGATWADAVVSDETVRNALFDGFTADVEKDKWALVVAALKNSTNNVAKTATNTITITLPTVVDYDISAKQTISLNITPAAVVGSAYPIIASNTMAINILPPVSAKVLDVRALSGTYKTGDTIEIKVKFDTAVEVIGIPTLALQIGSLSRTASYTTGSGIDTLTFNYVVQQNDSTSKLDYKATNSLTLSGATIRNRGTTVNVTLTLPSPTKTGSLSDTSLVVIDGVAPKLISGYPKVGTKTETTADVVLKLDEAATVRYVLVQKDAANVVPTVYEVLNMTGAAMTGAAITSTAINGTLTAIANTELTTTIRGLTANTDYTMYIAAKDTVGNPIAALAILNFTTADMTPPAMDAGYPEIKFPQEDSKISVLVKMNEKGKVYLAALPVGSPDITSDMVKAGKTSTGAAIASNMKAVITINDTSEATITLSSLPVSTTYDVYVAWEDTALNMTPTPVKLTARTSQLSLANVSINLAKGQITNTTTQMEYSFDEYNWKMCSANNTSITFDYSSEMLAIFVREAINPTNTTQVAIALRASIDEANAVVGDISYDISAGKVTNTSNKNLQVRINGGMWYTLNASSSAVGIQFTPGPLEIRVAVSEKLLASLPVKVDTIAVPLPEPELLYNVDENTIFGLSSEYEYRVDGGTWTTGAKEGMFTGTKKVEVRRKATKDKLSSLIQTIYFTAGTITAKASPATQNTANKKTVTITFEENTNKKTLTAQDVRDYILVGQWDTAGTPIELHNWGADFTVAWNTTGNALVITYNTMTGSSIVVNDKIRITSGAGIKNAAGTSNSYEAKGVLTGSFNTVPSILSVKAYNSDGRIGFGNGDKIIITFDQPTNRSTISAISIDDFLVLSNGHKWGITTNSAITWNSDGSQLTIVFNDVSKTTLLLTDKITVSETWGLTDAAETTEACQASSFISGSFTSPPTMSAVIVNGGNAGTKNVGDKLVITFDQPTNKKVLKSYQLNSYLKLIGQDGSTKSWGSQIDTGTTDIYWNTAGTVLTIKLNSITGVTMAAGDTLVLNTLWGLMDEDSTTSASGASCTIGGGY